MMNTIKKIGHYEPTEMHVLRRLLHLLLIPEGIIGLLIVLDFFRDPTASRIYGATSEDVLFARVFYVLIAPTIFLLLGALIYRRTRGNIIGLLIILLGCGAPTYAVSYTTPTWLVAAQASLIPSFYMYIFFIPVTFPDGKALNRWSSLFLTATMFFALGAGILGAIGQPVYNPLPGRIFYSNPYFVPAIEPIVEIYNFVWTVSFLPLILLIFVAPLVRYRATKVGSQERQQIKWLVLVAAVLSIMVLSYAVIVGFVGLFVDLNTLVEQDAATGRFFEIYQIVYAGVLFLFPPIILGNAILRHRLYDIDIIIRRTLVYAILTTILGVIYFGGIVLIQRIFQLVTGQNSEVAIVISTLLIVAIFTPLRRGVQAWIDRRFYRRKYDAEQTIAKFNETLRDEVDLETLKANLIGVVQETLQPSSIRLWVKE